MLMTNPQCNRCGRPLTPTELRICSACKKAIYVWRKDNEEDKRISCD